MRTYNPVVADVTPAIPLLEVVKSKNGNPVELPVAPEPIILP